MKDKDLIKKLRMQALYIESALKLAQGYLTDAQKHLEIFDTQKTRKELIAKY
jgi:hypothetical protein